MARLTADVAIASQMKPNCVRVYLSELPPNQMVEFGRVLDRYQMPDDLRLRADDQLFVQNP